MRTLKKELVDKGLSQASIQEVDKIGTRSSKKSKEKLSKRELQELMGCHRDTYSRAKGGALRRR